MKRQVGILGPYHLTELSWNVRSTSPWPSHCAFAGKCFDSRDFVSRKQKTCRSGNVIAGLLSEGVWRLGSRRHFWMLRLSSGVQLAWVVSWNVNGEFSHWKQIIQGTVQSQNIQCRSQNSGSTAPINEHANIDILWHLRAFEDGNSSTRLFHYSCLVKVLNLTLISLSLTVCVLSELLTSKFPYLLLVSALSQ